jgi:Fic family protein
MFQIPFSFLRTQVGLCHRSSMHAGPLPIGQWVPLSDIPGIPEALRREGAYIPPPLPSEITLPPATYRRAAAAEHALGRLDEAANRLSAREGLMRSTQVRDAQSSARLGGVHVGLREALAADLLASQDSVKRPDLLPVVAPYLRAYDHGLARVRAGARVDATLMGELSAIMTGRSARAVADVLRTEHGRLGTGAIGPYLVTAMGPHLIPLLEQWSDWVESETGQPRIAQLAIAHFQLEVLQPFPTANGHVARGFSMLELVRRGLLRSQILPLSVWLDDTLEDYQRHIRAVVDTGLIHPWVDFFATAVHDQALAQLRLISGLEELARRLSRAVSPSGTVAKVLADVIGFPVINHRAIEDRYGVSTKYATDVTRRLVKLGVLTNWESRRYNQIFLCEPVLDLLSLNPDTSAEPRRGVTS